MQCPSCGYEYRQGAAFCGQCGTRFEDTIACAACGATNPLGHRFCEACGQRLAEEQAPAADTTVAGESAPLSFVRGRYVVERVLGEGGKKRVYLARDTHLDRPVAFALLRADGIDAESLIRLRREAQAMGRVGGHPNVVTVFDVGDDHAKAYIVSEYMVGGDVAGLLREAQGGPLPLDRALDIAADVCRALDHAHALGVIHRDLKPGNVWLGRDGSAKLGDFGLALMDDRTRLSQEGLLYGTPFYMSPEQALGSALDGRADLYSLGALLFELVTGRPPFLGDDPVAVITQHLETSPVAPSWHNPEVPSALESLILRLLAKVPADRPESAAAGLESITAIASAIRAGVAETAPGANPLDRLAGGIYVGREQDTDELRAALEDALSGRGGRLLMLAGEPGIGKTRTAAELATYAQLRGARVLWGRCYESEVAPPYWPWTQIIRAYSGDGDAEALMAEIGSGQPEAESAQPEIAPEVPELRRFRLFDRLSRFFADAARNEPLVLVLDDLHSADESSLRFLRFFSHDLGDARILVLGTYNDVGLGRNHPLAHTIAELATAEHSRRIRLRGLSEASVERFIQLTAGIDPPPELVATVHRETEGNPFFVSEVVRLLVSDGRLDEALDAGSWTMTIPDGVREAIGLRLSRLSDSCNTLLAMASVIGREFDIAVLESASGLSDDDLMAALEEAIAARVVTDAPQAGGRYRFSHALIRDTLYEELPTPRRARLHGRIGAVLEAVHSTRLERHLDELAHHFIEAAQAGSVEKGVGYAARAGQQAAERLAYEEAAAHYGRALQALEIGQAPADARRCDLLLALGEAHAHAGDPARAKDAFRHAAELARASDDAERLGRAALGYGGPWVTFGVVDEYLLALLEETQAALGDGDGALRAMVLARMAAELYFSDAKELRTELARDAVDMARRVGDPAALAYAANARHGALWGPENAEERLEVATEIVQLAEAAGSDELALQGRARRVTDLLELGDIAAADAEIAVHAALAEQLREPAHLWYSAVWHAARAQFEGRFEDGERLAGEALALGRRLFESEAGQCHAVQVFFCRVDRGRAVELEDDFRHFGEEIRTVPGWRAALAQLYSEAGRSREARREFGPLAANDFRDLPRDNTWLPAIACASEACAFLGDASAAEVLYGLLLPYAARNIVAVEGWICLGSAARLLGHLAATMGRWEESEARFEAALELNARMGARPWLVRTQYQYAQMLLRRDEPSDRARAAELVDAAIEAARELGMNSVLERPLAVG